MIPPSSNWPTDVRALWLRDYMLRADDLLYASLAERRCNKHIIRHRKYAALGKGRANRTASDTFKAAHFSTKPLFRRVSVFFFFSFPKNEELILPKLRARNLSYEIPVKTDILSNFLTHCGAEFSSAAQTK